MDLRTLSVELGNKAYDRLGPNATPGERSAAYTSVVETILRDGDKIAEAWNRENNPYEVWADAQEAAWKHWNEECAENYAMVSRMAATILGLKPVCPECEGTITSGINRCPHCQGD